MIGQNKKKQNEALAITVSFSSLEFTIWCRITLILFLKCDLEMQIC
uniref:Uncharacterized protein n=1 Tax=Rhizophora mucronata TaxID=61149 RepID=A0A2P2PYE4_RHIMU